MNYPTAGSFDPNLLTVVIDQENTKNASKLTFHADRNSYVKSYDSIGNVHCDLSVHGTEFCTIDYRISVKSLNDTLG